MFPPKPGSEFKLPSEFRAQADSVDIDEMVPVENSDGTVTVSYKKWADKSEWYAKEMDKMYTAGKELLWNSPQRKSNGKFKILEVDYTNKTAKVEMMD